MKVKRSVHSQSSLSESTQMCFFKSSTHMFRSNRTPSRCPGGIQRPPTKLHKWAGPACEQGALALFFRSAADVAYSGESSAGPEHVQNSTPETWSHPHTHCAPPVRELWVACSTTQELPTRQGYAPRTLEQKSNSVGTKKLCWKCWAKKSAVDTQVTHLHTASKRCQPALLQTDRGWRIDSWIGGR